MRFRLCVDDSAADVRAGSVWPVFESVFGDYASCDEWRAAVWDRHRAREGFRLARGYDERTLVGLAYGYTGEHGQWWTDQASTVLDADVADAWLGGHFELVSIAVVEGARRAGLGRALLRALTDDLPHDRLLLMTTADGEDPARRLYASEGWHVIGPGIGDDRVIMGKRVAGSAGT